MPYTIIKKSGKFYVKNKHTGQVKNKKPLTRAEAEKYKKRLEMAHRASKSDRKMKS